MKILDTISLSSSTFVLEVEKPKFINKQQLKEHPKQSPYPYFSDDHVINYYKRVYVIPYIEKYYHNMMEFWPNILYLKNKEIKFTLVVIVDDPREFNNELKIPYGWVEDKTGNPNMYCFRRLLETNGIDYVCYPKNSKEYLEMCPKSAFIFFDEKKNLYTPHLRKSYPPEFYYKSYSPHEPCVSMTPELLDDRVEVLFKWAPRYASKGKRIYIARKNFEDRALTKEDILINYMSSIGYETVFFEDHQILEQIKIVQEASHIVVQSGSSLFNCMFANPGTYIYEIETMPYSVGIYEIVFNKYKIKWTKIKAPSSHGQSVVNKLQSDKHFQLAFVAQRTEQDSSKVLAAGSTPAEGA